MIENLLDAAWPLLLAGLSTGALWLFGRAQGWLMGAAAGNAWLARLQTVVGVLVLAADQTFGSGTGRDKKESVSRQALAMLAPARKRIERASGVTLEQGIDSQIEATVRAGKGAPKAPPLA